MLFRAKGEDEELLFLGDEKAPVEVGELSKAVIVESLVRTLFAYCTFRSFLLYSCITFFYHYLLEEILVTFVHLGKFFILLLISQ